MTFASLAEELGDSLDCQGTGNARSLADEIDLDLGQGYESVQLTLDDRLDSTGTSPDLTLPQAPPNRHSSSPSRTCSPSPGNSASKADSSYWDSDVSHSEGKKKGYMEIQGAWPSNGIPPSTPVKHGFKASTPSPMHRPVMTKDPLIELEQCLKSTSGMIVTLRSMEGGDSGDSGSRMLSSSSTKLLSTAGRPGDTVERLVAYSVDIAERERRLGDMMTNLEALMEQWTLVAPSSASDEVVDAVVRTTSWLSTDKHGKPKRLHEGLPASASKPLGMPSVWVEAGEEDHPIDPFLVTQATHQVSSHSGYKPGVGDLLLDIVGDGTHQQLLDLSETLDLHSSLAVAAQQQIRHIKGALQAAQARDVEEEIARRGLEAWETQRVQDGLKGLSVADKLERELDGFRAAVDQCGKGMDDCIVRAREYGVGT